MPALVCAGRRWLAGSDDFFFTSVSFGGWSLLVAMLLLIPYYSGSCPQPMALALGFTAIVGVFVFLLLLYFTCRGKILETSARAPVVPILYFTVVYMLAVFGISIAALADFFRGDFPASCAQIEQLAMKAAGILAIIMPFSYAIMSFVLRWDSTGGLSEEDLRADMQLYHDSWARKVRKAFCCFNIDDHSEYFDHVAGLLAYLFQGHDIVPSDILAGMSLLGSHQRRVMQERAAKITSFDQSKCAHRFEVSHQALPLPKLTSEDLAVIDDVANFAKFFMATYGWALYIYRDLKCGLCKIACAGGPCCGFGCCKTRPGVHIGDNCCGCNTAAMQATARLQDEDIIFTSFLNETMRPEFYVAVDRVTNSVVIAIRGTMSLQDTLTDLVATPVKMNIRDLNGPGTAAAAAAAAASNTTAAVSIPSANADGNSNVATKSEEGAAAATATATADNNKQPPAAAAASVVAVHGGMLKASTNVFDSLCQQNIFKLLIDADGPHRDKKLKVIGHSLGAGCATILTLLIRERFPELRPRTTCLAVSPPGGLLSRDLADYTRGFIVSPFVGMDVIPRLAVHNMEKTRDAVFECLSASTHNKNSVLMHGLCPCDGGSSLLPDPAEVPELPSEIGERVQRLLSGQCAATSQNVALARDKRVEERAEKKKVKSTPGLLKREHALDDYTIKLYPPGRLLHYNLTGTTSEGHCCCGTYTCGQSGPDGFCSKRVHLPLWVEVEDMQEIMSCPAMMLDHFPDRCQNIFETTRFAIRNGDYEGCFDANLTVEAAAKQRREYKPTCFTSAANNTFRNSASVALSSADYGGTTDSKRDVR